MAPAISHAAPVPDTAPTGGDGAFDNRQSALALNLSVATVGLFPSGSGGGGTSLTLGAIRIAAFNFLPGGSADTDGRLLSIASNAALFSLLGTTFGGDGATTFALPDLGTVLPVGEGAGPGLGPVAVGAQLGFSSVVLPVSGMPAHAHPLPASSAMTGTTGGSAGISSLQDSSLGVVYAINTGGIFPGGAVHGFLGEINLFAVANSAGLPSGWTPAEGQILPIASNTALFSLLGTTYGGDGTTTFALPDFRGRSAIGVGAGPGRLPVSLGQMPGSESQTLTVNELPSHAHGLPPGIETTGVTGADGAFSILQPSLGVHFMIALSGLFPSPGSGAPDGDTPFVGELVMYGGVSAPGGWVFAEGQLLSIASNTALFSLLGTIYGGDGTTTFALPDLRGRSIVDESATMPIGSSVDGDLTTLTVATLPSHVHPVPEPSSLAASVTALLSVFVVAGIRRRSVASRQTSWAPITPECLKHRSHNTVASRSLEAAACPWPTDPNAIASRIPSRISSAFPRRSISDVFSPASRH